MHNECLQTNETSHEGSDVPFQSVAIVGMGLMGGALGLALKKFCPQVTVHAYARREETRKLALEMGACDHVSDRIVDAVQDAELVVLCTPILDIPDLVEEICDRLRPGAIVTDVGSTKEMLMEEVAARLAGRDACFIGSHPMAGSERTGIEAADEDLYAHAVVIVTPPADNALLPQTRIVEALWRSIGARVLVTHAADHDAIVAGTSHVPHLLAALLVRAAARSADKPGAYCGPGFRDCTRIASGSEGVWHDIVKSNAGPIAASLQGVRSDIDLLLDALDRKDFDAIRELLGEAREVRENIVGTKGSRILLRQKDSDKKN